MPAIPCFINRYWTICYNEHNTCIFTRNVEWHWLNLPVNIVLVNYMIFKMQKYMTHIVTNYLKIRLFLWSRISNLNVIDFVDFWWYTCIYLLKNQKKLHQGIRIYLEIKCVVAILDYSHLDEFSEKFHLFKVTLVTYPDVHLIYESIWIL